MKKILALVLALVMVLTAVSALAAGSPVKPDDPVPPPQPAPVNPQQDEEETEEPVIIEKVTELDEDTEALVTELVAAGEDKILEEIPAEVLKDLPADFNKVSEILVCEIEKNEVEEGVKAVDMSFSFVSTFGENDVVYLLLGIVIDKDNVDWTLLEGKGNKDGGVTVSLETELLDKIADNQFVLIPVSNK